MHSFQGLQLRRLAVLAGAGISLDDPTNLLDGGRFMQHILSRLCPSDLSSYEFKKITDLKKRRPGEFIRFESLMSSLTETKIDPELSVFKCLRDCRHPNKDHFILASLIHQGCVVMTTNFDTLIEEAYSRLNPGDWPGLTVFAYDQDYTKEVLSLAHDNRAPTLWKLHGSTTRDGIDTRDSIEATLARVSAWSQKGMKYDFIRAVLRSHDLIVVGYSGSDDFDIISLLAETKSERKLLWIDHKGNEPVEHDAKSIKATLPLWEVDTVGRDRVFFNEDQAGAPIRVNVSLILIEGPTATLLSTLHEHLCSEQIFPQVEGRFEFGRDFPDNVESFFEQWNAQLNLGDADRYRFLSHLYSMHLSLDDSREAMWVRDRNVYWTLRPKNPSEKLSLLVAVFNEGNYHYPPTVQQEKELGRIASDAADLRPHLNPEDVVLLWRLMGCICYLLGDSDEGDEFFQVSLVKARDELKDAQLEFFTLSTWRKFWMDSQGKANKPSSSQVVEIEGKKVSARRGYDYFKAEARFAELERGLDLSNSYRDELGLDLAVALSDAAYPEVVELTNRALRYRRFAVNIGDIRGEALASLRLAYLYDSLEDFDKSRAELLRVEELETILRTPVPRSKLLMQLPSWRAGMTNNEALALQARVRSSMRHYRSHSKPRRRWWPFGGK